MTMWRPLLVALLLPASLAAQSPVFRTAVEFVPVDVSVRRGERPVSGLTAADFELRDNGVVQAIADVTYESSPIDITLMVDLSGSVTGPLLASLTRAVDRVSTTLRATDRVHLVSFNQYIRERPSPTIAGEALSSALDSPSGGTALFDALVASSIRPREPGYRPLLIAFTDGDDSMSFLDERSVLEVARRAGVSIFLVAAVDRSGPTGDRPLKHRALFDAIARFTGGEVAVIGRNEDVGDAFVRAVTSFRDSYVLRYELDGARRPGWHEIDVRVKREGKFDVRARQGYYASAAGTDAR